MKSSDSHRSMVNSSRFYKRILNEKLKIFQQDVNNRLLNLRTSEPKSFWNALNKYSGERKEIINKVSNQAFYEHFVKLNQTFDNKGDAVTDFDFSTVTGNNDVLNTSITVQEVRNVIKHLKNNKSPSIFDNVLNEYFKYANNELFLSLICQLFNIVLDSGIFPDVWSKGIIIPIYKNKGDKTDPNNYRGITILSCFGKLFTNIINNRLNHCLEDNNLLNEEQAGFRKKYSTIDHIFSLKLLVDFYLGAKKKKQTILCFC